LPGQPAAAATLLGGGYSNTNVLIATGRGRYVLRRYRRGPRDAARRTCAIEAALAARLARTAVPVPEVIAADPEGTAAGEPLLLTRHVPGVLVSDAVRRPPGPPGSSSTPTTTARTWTSARPWR